MDLIHGYGDYLKTERHASENTVCSYLRDVTQFSDYLGRFELGSLPQAAEEEIRLFSAWQKKNGKSSASVARYVASLKSFYTYLVQTGQLDANPAAPDPHRQGSGATAGTARLCGSEGVSG